MRNITSCLEEKFEMYEHKKQAGFRKEYGITEHLYTIRHLIEKAKIQLKLCIGFNDFNKAFGTLEIWTVVKATRNARID